MYGICGSRLNLCFFPYASRMIIHNSWMGTNPVIKTVMVVSDGNNTNTSTIPYYNVLLPVCLSTPELCTSKGTESLLPRYQETGDPNEVTLEISVEMHNPLLSLPVIYMTRNHLQVNRSTTYLNASWKDASHLSLQHLMAVSTKKKQKSNSDKETDCNAAAKMVKVLKKSIEKTELKKKFGCNSESPPTITSAAPALGTKTAKEKRASSNSSSSNIGISWGEIEKKLPFWQNLIADILQKLQDIITRRR